VLLFVLFLYSECGLRLQWRCSEGYKFGINFAVVHYGEKGLKEKFGKEYDEYMEKVPRWIPRFRMKN
jgi:protein-S-isoprenylcysteine O-methyltransferase Ste14